ncbi:MAG TPA: ABC transporter ATP-binding protein [Bacilli bacterium]
MLKIEDLEVAYGESQALFGVTMEVKEGEVCALIGANGAGKTTTLRTISGLLKARKGVIYLNGEPIHKAKAHRIVELGISHVPEGRGLFPRMTVKENLLLGAHIRRVRNRSKANLEHVMKMFPRLQERENQLAGTLSGGEQQMVAIARGLMSNPKLLILDEPSLGLAPIIVEEMFRIIKEISANTTVLIVEQNVSQTLQIADSAFVLEHGKVVASGTGQALLNDELVKTAYLGL